MLCLPVKCGNENRFMKKLLPFSCFLFLLACTNEQEAKTVDMPSAGGIYQNFLVSGEEGREAVTVRLQFHEGGRDGDAILLHKPVNVFLDDTPLPPDSTKFNGVYYEVSVPVADFTGRHTIRFTGNDGKEYKEEFNFAPFTLAKEIPEAVKKEPFAIQLKGVGEASEFIRLVIVDTSMQSADVNEDVLMEEGRIVITEDHLANLTDGPVYLELYREQEQLVRNKAKGGGKLVIAYALKRQLTLLR